MVPHIVGCLSDATRCGVSDGGTSSGRVDGRTVVGVTGSGALGSAGRSGPGSRDRLVDQRLDERTDCPGVWGDSGQREALAKLVRRGWSGGIAGERTLGPRSGEERCGGARGRSLAGGAGCRPGELDFAPAASRDRAASRGLDLEVAAQQDAKKNGYRWRRPRHCLVGRQDPDAVDRAGLRLKLLRLQAEAGDIVLLSQDESEALTHPYLAHAWAKRGADLRVPAPGQSRKMALIGALDHATGTLIVHRSPTKRSADFIGLLERLDQLYGPSPGRPAKPVVIALDNGPIHTSKLSRAALDKRPWLTVLWLPKYAPELNDIERTWRDLKRHFLAHMTFRSVEELDIAVASAVDKLNHERARNSCHNQRIAA
jgi:transposase